MTNTDFPRLDVSATGKNILLLLKTRNVSIKELQSWLGFADVRAIYAWAEGHALPAVDNLYAMSVFLDVPIDQILVGSAHHNTTDR